MSHYPRTCRNGHTVAGPDDEITTLRPRPNRPQQAYPINYCLACRRAAQARYDARLTRSGASAEKQARLLRARAEARDRITRSGVETKTKLDDTETMNPFRDPTQHPGRECSPECAEFGCGRWTGIDADHVRRENAKHEASHVESGRRFDPLDGPHVPYPQPDEVTP